MNNHRKYDATFSKKNPFRVAFLALAWNEHAMHIVKLTI